MHPDGASPPVLELRFLAMCSRDFRISRQVRSAFGRIGGQWLAGVLLQLSIDRLAANVEQPRSPSLIAGCVIQSCLDRAAFDLEWCDVQCGAPAGAQSRRAYPCRRSAAIVARFAGRPSRPWSLLLPFRKKFFGGVERVFHRRRGVCLAARHSRVRGINLLSAGPLA